MRTLTDNDLLWLHKNITTMRVTVLGEVDEMTDWLGGLLALSKDVRAENASLKAENAELRNSNADHGWKMTEDRDRIAAKLAIAKEALEWYAFNYSDKKASKALGEIGE